VKAGRMVFALAQLSERERLLLLLLGLIVVPLAVIFLAVIPLIDARDAARGRAESATAMLDWVADQVRALPAETAAVVESDSTVDPIGISDLEESLVNWGLRENVSLLSNRVEGGVDLALDAARFDDLGNWLLTMMPDWGYQVTAFRIETVSDGIVNATFELEAE